jgi:aspartokinase
VKAGGGNMVEVDEPPVGQVFGEVQELTVRVESLKTRLSRQNFHVVLEHYWELRSLRSRFAEFKWRVQQLEDDNEVQLKRDQAAIQIVWNDIKHTVESLTADFQQFQCCIEN